MSPPVIEISNLSKFYGKVRGIDNISLSIEEGEIFGFIGPNGAGKSTTIRLLLNLIFPTSGKAKIFGMDVIRDTRKIKEQIAYVPSEAGTYSSMTVSDFLDYSARFYNADGAEERKISLSEQFGLDLKRQVSELSSGNRRKVAIIQSLLHSPKLLILDEPTSGLDPLMQAKFFELLREENRKGATILYSSHVLSEIQNLCGRVAIIREGRIIKLEEIETLRKKQLKRVTVEFAEKPAEHFFKLPGITGLDSGADNSAFFMYSGNLNDLLNGLAGMKMLNLTIEEPPLEEIFMHYYNKKEQQA